MLTLGHVAGIVGAAAPSRGAGLPVCGFSTDTRSIRPGELFIALDGPNFRGSDYIDEAFRAGAVAAVAERGESDTGAVLLVDDASAALLRLGEDARARLDAPVAAITGTVGKTTTKDVLAALLGGRETVAAERSFNNGVGVPLTLLRTGRSTEALVLEIGASAPGEIARLTRAARPTHALVTLVAPGHLEGFGDLDVVAREKLSLFEGLEPGGVAFVNGDDPRLAAAEVPAGVERVSFGFGAACDVRAVDVEVDECGSSFRLRGEDVRIAAPLVGRHNVMNVLAAIALARALDVPLEEIARRARDVAPAALRMESRVVGDMTVLFDCYNANPTSMNAALDAWTGLGNGARRVAILGDMLELGGDDERYHRELGRRLARTELDDVVLVGRHVGATRDEMVEAGFDASRILHVGDVIAGRPAILARLAPGDHVLLKGSRGVRLERLFDGGAG